MKKITNPLTVIGIFAGIAQVAGTIVLPLVEQELQSVFIWYVMGFPVLLVLLFFATLIFKPKVLYAPSDFTDEQNFMKLYDVAAITQIETEIETIKKNNPTITPELINVQSLLNNIASTEKSKYSKELAVLALVANSENGITAGEISRQLSFPRQLTYDILNNLDREDLIEGKKDNKSTKPEDVRIKSVAINRRDGQNG